MPSFSLSWFDHLDENEVGRYTVVLATNSSISFAGLSFINILESISHHTTVESFLNSMAWLTA